MGVLKECISSELMVNLFVYAHIKTHLGKVKLADKFLKACKLTVEEIEAHPLDYERLKKKFTATKKDKSEDDDDSISININAEKEVKKKKKKKNEKSCTNNTTTTGDRIAGKSDKNSNNIKKVNGNKRNYQSSDEDDSPPPSKFKKFEQTEREKEFEASDKSDVQCYKCQNYGHFSFACPVTKCYNCNEMGHMSGACPLKREQSGNNRRGGGGRGGRDRFVRKEFTGANCIPLGPRKSASSPSNE